MTLTTTNTSFRCIDICINRIAIYKSTPKFSAPKCHTYTLLTKSVYLDERARNDFKFTPMSRCLRIIAANILSTFSFVSVLLTICLLSSSMEEWKIYTDLPALVAVCFFFSSLCFVCVLWRQNLPIKSHNFLHSFSFVLVNHMSTTIRRNQYWYRIVCVWHSIYV